MVLLFDPGSLINNSTSRLSQPSDFFLRILIASSISPVVGGLMSMSRSSAASGITTVVSGDGHDFFMLLICCQQFSVHALDISSCVPSEFISHLFGDLVHGPLFSLCCQLFCLSCKLVHGLSLVMACMLLDFLVGLIVHLLSSLS